MPCRTSKTGMVVCFPSKSVSMLWCLGSRCWIRTKPIPVSAGKCLTSSVTASMPPADAPMATTTKSPSPADDVEPVPVCLELEEFFVLLDGIVNSELNYRLNGEGALHAYTFGEHHSYTPATKRSIRYDVAVGQKT